MFADYIGNVHNAEKTREYGSATTKRVKVRNIGIRNLMYIQFFHSYLVNLQRIEL